MSVVLPVGNNVPVSAPGTENSSWVAWTRMDVGCRGAKGIQVRIKRQPCPSPTANLVRTSFLRFRTIMAYSTKCSRAPRVNVFSNPDKMYDGQVQGTDQADNARVLNEAMVRCLNCFLSVRDNPLGIPRGQQKESTKNFYHPPPHHSRSLPMRRGGSE